MIYRSFLPVILLLLINAPLSMAQTADNSNTQPAATTVDDTINIELRRIHRELTLLRMEQKKPKITDVIGGIGYIMGICGIAAYILAERDRKKDPHT